MAQVLGPSAGMMNVGWYGGKHTGTNSVPHIHSHPTQTQTHTSTHGVYARDVKAASA